MHHLAIMKKSWRLTKKILTGEKKIESRWYATKRGPWDNIAKGDTVYFKDSGEPVKLCADVNRVAQYAGLTPARVRELLREYGKDDGIGEDEISDFYSRFKDKKYCVLIFLGHPRSIKPFEIDKTGYGAMAAWISVDDIDSIKV